MKTADLIGSDFSVSSYVDNKIKEQIQTPKKDNDNIAEALDWQEVSNIHIVITAKTLEELEEQWIAFNSMPIKLRRESDWKSLELFGVTNKDHYEHIKDTLLERDIKENNPSIESNIDSIPLAESTDDYEGAEGYYKDQNLNYGPIDIENAIEWGRESYRIIIVPTRTLTELEFLWTAYQSMVYKHRRESDWKSLELFGVTNLKHYEYLKAEFLKDDVTPRDNYLAVESSQLLISKYLKNNKLSLAETAKIILEAKAQNNSIYEELLTNNIISDVIDGNIELFSSAPNMDLPNGDLPYLSPEEMIDMGVYGQTPAENYYGVLADNNLLDSTTTVAEWFKAYDLSTKGFYTEFYRLSSPWVDKVRGLSYDLKRLKESGAEENIILAKKQSLLELGWNPEVEFTENARILAKEMAINRVVENMSYSTIIDLEGFTAPVSSNSFLNEDTNTSGLKPVFVILTEGKTWFSDTIKKVTNDIYSHCSISFDPHLRKMYSFGVEGSKKGIRGGFIEEDVANTPEGCRIGVFVFFVSQNIFDAIMRMVDSFKENVDRTSYGYKNLVTYLFKVPYERDWNLICSQFVDRCLKSAGIDVTHTASSLVAPSDMDAALKKNRRIYSLYKGLASKYNGSKIQSLLNSLVLKVKPLKEVAAPISESSYIFGLVSNIFDTTFILEMKQYSNIVSNKILNDFLENCLFEALEVKPYIEAREFPVQFDKQGNLLIRNDFKPIDYDAEFAKSHKLLNQYRSRKNIEGIKYEIAKLWMMLCNLEKNIHKPHVPSDDLKHLRDAKAKINNDFQYYLKFVLENDPEFNFTEYFEASPYYSGATKVNRTTLDAIGRMIKKFIRPF